MSKFDMSKMLDFSDITPRVKTHLNQVYGTLSIACMAATASCILMPAFLVQNLVYVIFSIIATIGLVVTMMSNRGDRNHGTKFVCLLAIAAIDGASLKPLIELANDIDPMLVVNALIYTAAIFGSFSLASLMTKRRSMLFLGGILSSVMIGMSVGMLFSWIIGYSFISFLGYNIVMLGVFSFYVIYDTQLIVEKAHSGDFDYTLHALELFIDLIRIFVHVLRILIELSGEKKKKN
jgi:FtsH-binding integral membrane protein